MGKAAYEVVNPDKLIGGLKKNVETHALLGVLRAVKAGRLDDACKLVEVIKAVRGG